MLQGALHETKIGKISITTASPQNNGTYSESCVSGLFFLVYFQPRIRLCATAQKITALFFFIRITHKHTYLKNSCSYCCIETLSLMTGSTIPSSSFHLEHSQHCLVQYAPFWNCFPERHRGARDRASAPRPPYTAALGVAAERTGANAKLGRRRVLKVGLPEAANNDYCDGTALEGR